MRKLKERLYIRLLAWTFCGMTVILLFCSVFTLRLFEFQYRLIVEKAYRSLCSIPLVEFSKSNETVMEQLDETAGKVEFVICDEDFNMVACSDRFGAYRELVGKMRQNADEYLDQPKAVIHENWIGRPMAVQGRSEEDGKTYYLYVYKNTRNLRANISFGMRMLCLFFFVLFLFAAFVYDRILSRETRSLSEIGSGLKRLAAGNYLDRMEEKFAASDLQEMTQNINKTAQSIHYDKSLIENLKYVLAKKTARTDETDVSSVKLARNITHQLKTPLAIISSQVELFNIEKDAMKREYYYNSIMEEIDKMSMLISNILTEAKAEHDYISIRLRRINISELFEELASKYESWLVSGDIRFSYTVDPDLYAMADPVQLEQAVHNYMMNAFGHTRKGKEIRLTCTRDGEWAQIVVFNEGDGIPVREMESIWEDSYQGEKTHNQQEVGLGLYIVKDIVIQHKGTCGLRNVSNGVEFGIGIPLLVED